MATSSANVSNFGQISIHGKPYALAPIPDSYAVAEVPAHGDIDQKMERRVIYRGFSGGIQPRREEPSMDATASSSPSFSFIRQNKITQGFYWANGCDTRQGDRLFPQRLNVASNFSDSTQAPSLIGDATVFSWAVSKNTIYALQVAPSTWLTSAVTIPTITDAVQYGGFLYVAVGNSNSFYTWDQTNTNSNWVQRTSSANNFVVIRNQLWRSNGASIFSTVNTDPANQVWSSATIVGDPNTNINYLDVWGDFIMIFKQDGIYNADKTGNVYPLFPGFRNLGTNPRPIGQWRDSYYFASDVGLVWEISKTGVKRIGFDLAEPFPMGGTASTSPILGTPNAATRGVPLTNYLVVGFNQFPAQSNSGAYFLAWDGKTWHPYAYFANSTVNGLGETGGNQSPVAPTVQLSCKGNGSTNKIFYQSQPLVDPVHSGSFDTTPQVLYLTVDNGALEDESKVLERINCWIDNPQSGTLKIAYALDENISNLTFADMGTPIGNGSQSAQQFLPPSPLPTYRKIQLRVTIQANTSTNSPIVRYIILHYKQRTPQRRTWTLMLLSDKNTVGPTARVDVRDARKIVADLDAARQVHEQVDFVDILGVTYSVYVDEVSEKIKIQKAGQSPSFIVQVLLVEASVEQLVQ